jgi:hypothetical protein
LATVCSAQQKFGAAESFQKRSLRIRGDLFGHECPRLVPNLENLSWIYTSMRRDQEAKETNQRIVRIREASASGKPGGAGCAD